jgi:glycosyltransferase involved in cell wall biosynthesis
MKKVLMLAYFFAPRNHIASLRAGCFAKFLPENGWLPTVICDYWGPENSDYNPGIIGELGDHIKVHQIRAPRPRGIYSRLISRKLGPYLWPEKCPIDWFRLATRKASELLSREHFDAIWATSDPLVPLAVGRDAAAEARLPWVADIRDSFILQPFGSWYRRPFSARAEHRLCRDAAAVVTVSSGLASGLEHCLNKPVHVVTNGFDPTLLPDYPPAVDAETFTLLYTGNVAPREQTPQLLFDALEVCTRKHGIPVNRIKVIFVGSRVDDLKRCLNWERVQPFIEVLPPVAHNEVLKLQRRSAVLLSLTHPGTKGIPTTKIFDYLAAKRPILAIPDDGGDINALLASTGAGVARTTPESIAEILKEWFERWLADSQFQLAYYEGEINRHSRREHTKQLASILDSLGPPGSA